MIVKSDEIRSSYLKFFEARGHKIVPSSSLIPYGDPTLLLTSAGMVQFKPYFTQKAVPPHPRLTTCQKCFRTTDIEEVGDATHCTFFEMLGNFSFGDYFKKEVIPWAWEYVTQYLKIPPSRLWVTIFRDDDDAFHIWRQIGVPEDRIVRLGEKDNFWGPAGNSGPCGPCSEIHYDLGEKYGCGKPDCKPGCGCKRYTEIWNLVFTEFDQDEKGKRTKLPKPNIDTGMGLERVSTIMQGKLSFYDTDLFAPLIRKVEDLAGKKYGSDAVTDNAMRVVAEHARGITFLLADGVMPSKDGRGYVLRRLLRRAEYFGETLAHEKPFLVTVAEEVIKNMGHLYPELMTNKKHILHVIEAETDSFRKSLPVGRGILENTITKLAAEKNHVISGYDAFVLHDTYGFPIDLTKEIAASRGLTVDLAGFEQEMEKQRERAKAAQKYGVAGNATAAMEAELEGKPTVFVGYQRTVADAVIISLLAEGEEVGVIREGQEASLALDITPFYGEMGGQVGDTGEIKSQSGRFSVTDTVRTATGIIVHRGKMLSGTMSAGDKVQAEVNAERRLDIARNHTATHLLQYALRQVLGKQVQQRGSLVTPGRFRFDFAYLEAMMPGEIIEVQQIVNEKVRQNLEVYAEEMSYSKALEQGAIALFDEKYGDKVRALKVGKPPVSFELCGGTHVNATGQIGFFHIVSESSIGSGLRRIEAVTGRGAEAHFESLSSEWQEIARSVDATRETVKEKVLGTVAAFDNERKQRQAIEKELARKVAESLVAEEIKGVKVIVAQVPSLPPQILRDMSDILREQLKSGIIVLGTIYEDKPSFLAVVTQDIVSKGYNAGNIVREVAKVTGGGGGGKPTMAQAGGKDKTRIDEALRLVKNLIMHQGE
ncbi:MAG: alanine--tRNA ligase [Dehalococcoidales bacterium]|nr:alanine--tRNA ligase [Dehalococcoidales bacterium]